MSGKRPSLAESMRQAASATELPASAAVPMPAPAATKLVGQTRSAGPRGFYAATRAGKKKVTATLAPAAHKQLKNLGVDKERTTEALLTEAINDLFRKYGKEPIA